MYVYIAIYISLIITLLNDIMFMCWKNLVLTAPIGVSECRRNLQFASSLNKDQRCAANRVQKRKMISEVLEEVNGNVYLPCSG